jgi:hypothetical protein
MHATTLAILFQNTCWADEIASGFDLLATILLHQIELCEREELYFEAETHQD